MTQGELTEKLRERAAEVRARALIGQREGRQRRHAKGSWERVRWVLAQARRAWIVSEATADMLDTEGYLAEAAGFELHPVKRLYSLPPERIEAIAERRPTPLRLDAAWLAARVLVLEPFPKVAEGRLPWPG